MKRSPLKPGKPLARKTPMLRSRKPMRRQSVKRAAKARAFAPVREEVHERDGQQCQTNRIASELTTVMPVDWPVCTWWLIDPHHRDEQGSGGEDTPRNVDTTCRAHHDWIHGHPIEAKQLGLLA